MTLPNCAAHASRNGFAFAHSFASMTASIEMRIYKARFKPSGMAHHAPRHFGGRGRSARPKKPMRTAEHSRTSMDLHSCAANGGQYLRTASVEEA